MKKITKKTPTTLTDHRLLLKQQRLSTNTLPLTPLSPTTATATTMTNFVRQSKNKNLMTATTLNRIKYDSELLIHYLFDNNVVNSDATKADVNLIKVCKVKVTQTCGTILAHYFAQIELSNGYKFEFHPGSQPRTFQQIHSKGHLIMIVVCCDECCKSELRSYVEGENDFNVAFHNCESILCKRKSMQTVFVSLALLVITFNMFKFSWYYIFFVFFILFLLFMNNNYLISSPRVLFCSHKRQIKNVHHANNNNNNNHSVPI
ncbi:ac81 [Artaxa digramma nucleopolyhedrovirus]|uniref:Ac81 n=1 Tax=Artaxa digramma nucleopolyhedrovirus TaxID=3070910 RepID=A0AAE6R6C0_9ABAC|nr:ac81 [Euproctis digramma nucleopolyhedrovirus]QHB21735.1 ac81 [Artaxa digramma nucleopolyhedrovirus]